MSRYQDAQFQQGGGFANVLTGIGQANRHSLLSCWKPKRRRQRLAHVLQQLIPPFLVEDVLRFIILLKLGVRPFGRSLALCLLGRHCWTICTPITVGHHSAFPISSSSISTSCFHSPSLSIPFSLSISFTLSSTSHLTISLSSTSSCCSACSCSSPIHQS